MTIRRYFFFFLTLFAASFLSSSAFGTFTNFDASSLNAPNPLGFRSGLSVTRFPFALFELFQNPQLRLAEMRHLLVDHFLIHKPEIGLILHFVESSEQKFSTLFVWRKSSVSIAVRIR